MKCAACGRLCDEGSLFCRFCGAGLPKTTTVSTAPEPESPCPHCRKSISVQATKCPYCGSDVAAHMYAVRDPRSISMGMLGGALGVIVGVLIHKKMLTDFAAAFRNADGCGAVCLLPCLAPVVFILAFMLGLYFVGGCLAGILIEKAIKK